MTCEQQYQQIVDSVSASINSNSKKIKGCQMHPVLSAKCRKCKEIL